MGRTHATSGAVAYLAVAPLLPSWLGVHPGPVGLAVGTVAAAGAAMLPDLDHQHATVAQSLGPITKAAATVVGAVSGGHRNGTHSLLGLVAFTAAGWGLASLGGWALGAFLGFLLAIASAALHVEMAKMTIAHTVVCITGAIGLLVLAGTDRFPPLVVAPAVAIGTAAHIAGDMLTKEGCPLGWPLLRTRLKVWTLTTDGPVERLVVGPALGVAALVLLVAQAGLLGPDGLHGVAQQLGWHRSVEDHGSGGPSVTRHLLDRLRDLLA